MKAVVEGNKMEVEGDANELSAFFSTIFKAPEQPQYNMPDEGQVKRQYKKRGRPRKVTLKRYERVLNTYQNTPLNLSNAFKKEFGRAGGPHYIKFRKLYGYPKKNVAFNGKSPGKRRIF